MKKIIIALTVALGIALVPTAAHAGGSDAPTPYTVDAVGITLPAGVTFPDNGHVNIKTNLGDFGLHFESLNNQPSGQWIGQSHLPWSAFGLDPAKVCVIWVQVSMYNEHFGEGGQPPVGAGCGAVPPPIDPPVDPPVEVCWLLPDGGTPDNMTWPQTYVPDCVPPCEATLQVDTYPTSAVAALIADGVLVYGEDHGIAISWRFVTGEACVEEPPVEEPPVEEPEPEEPTLATAGPEDAMLVGGIGLLASALGAGFVFRRKIATLADRIYFR